MSADVTPPASEAAAALMAALLPILRRNRTTRTLSPGKLGILRHLAEHGRAGTSELAAAVQVSQQAVSLSARELEDQGLLRRVPDETDRRRTWFLPTDAGRQRYADEVRSGQAWLDAAIHERLNAEERRILDAAIPVLHTLTAEAVHG